MPGELRQINQLATGAASKDHAPWRVIDHLEPPAACDLICLFDWQPQLGCAGN
jgi:hypothetical protein